MGMMDNAKKDVKHMTDKAKDKATIMKKDMEIKKLQADKRAQQHDTEQIADSDTM